MHRGLAFSWAHTPLSGHKNRNAPPRMATASRASMTIVISEDYHDSPGASSSFAHAFHASQLFSSWASASSRDGTRPERIIGERPES
jgi:hypothetical protein